MAEITEQNMARLFLKRFWLLVFRIDDLGIMVRLFAFSIHSIIFPITLYRSHMENS